MLCARSSRWGTERRARNRSRLTRGRLTRRPLVGGPRCPIMGRRSLGRLNPRRPGNWRYPLAVPAMADQAVGAWTAVRIIAVE